MIEVGWLTLMCLCLQGISLFPLCFLKFWKLFGCISGDTSLFVSSKRRLREALNFAVLISINQSIQFWSGFIPVNRGGRIYPSSDLYNSHSPSSSIQGVLLSKHTLLLFRLQYKEKTSFAEWACLCFMNSLFYAKSFRDVWEAGPITQKFPLLHDQSETGPEILMTKISVNLSDHKFLFCLLLADNTYRIKHGRKSTSFSTLSSLDSWNSLCHSWIIWHTWVHDLWQ